MSQRDLETRLRGAVHAEAEEADPGALRERVISIPDTVEPRRRRWWHGLGLGTGRGAGLDGARVTGGSTMFSAARVALVVAALTVGTAFALSTSNAPAGPGTPAAQAPAAEWVTVTGTETTDCGYPTCTSIDAMSDDRVSGEGRITWVTGRTPASGTDQELWGTYTLSNDGGGWQGQWIGFVDADGMHHITWWLRGSDGYDGLSYLAFGEQQPDGELALSGLVYPGDIPPTVVLETDLEPAS